MEIKINIDNLKLKEFGLEGIFKEAQKQLERMDSKMFFKDKYLMPDLNAEETLKELRFQGILDRPKRKYSQDEMIQMQKNALDKLRDEVLEIVHKMNATDLSNFVRRNQ